MDHCTILSFFVGHKQKTRRSIFGNSIQRIMAEQRYFHPDCDQNVPEILKTLFGTLNFNTEGIFRIAGNTSTVKAMKKICRPGKMTFDQPQFSEVKDFEKAVSDDVIHIESESELSSEAFLRSATQVFKKFNQDVQPTVIFLLDQLGEVIQHQEVNKMNPKNLAVCWAPTLFSVTDMKKLNFFIAFLEKAISSWKQIKPNL